MSAYLAQKARECEQLRLEAKAASGVGRSLHSLAPVIANELQQFSLLQLRSGKLASDWQAALAAAEKSPRIPEESREVAALAALLDDWANQAGKLLRAHGSSLMRKAGQREGKAEGIEATISEMADGDAAEAG